MTEKETLELLRKTFEIPHELLGAIVEQNKSSREYREAEKDIVLGWGKVLLERSNLLEVPK